MSRKSLTIVILFLIVILGIVGYGYLLFKGSNGEVPNTGTNNEPRRNFFFFSNDDEEPNIVDPGQNTETPIDPGTEPLTPPDVPLSIPNLRQLTTWAVAGATASTSNETVLVRHINRGTGHVLQNYLDSAGNSETISNTTIPKIYEALWNNKADKVLFRYANDTGSIMTFAADILPAKPTAVTGNASTTPLLNRTAYEIKGTYLTSDIQSIALSPKTDRMFYLTSGINGAVGYTSTLSEGSRAQVFESPLSRWQAEWPEENTITLTTSPTGSGTGYMYFLNPKTGAEKKIISGVRGLTTLTSKDAEKVLYSASRNNTIETYLYTIDEGKRDNVPFTTLPEKCVWGKLSTKDLYCAVPIQITQGNYPDLWYQGRTSFIDKIWYINTDTGEVRLLSDIYSAAGKGIDAINLKLDEREDFLIFMDKNDLTLWSLDIR